MKPVIVTKGLKASRALREYATRRLGFALNRLHHNIRAVTLRISDKNGQKGGIDKRCLITLSVPGLPDIVITETADNANTAIDRAIHRAAYTAHRLLARAKSISHARPLVLDPEFA